LKVDTSLQSLDIFTNNLMSCAFFGKPQFLVRLKMERDKKHFITHLLFILCHLLLYCFD